MASMWTERDRVDRELRANSAEIARLVSANEVLEAEFLAQNVPFTVGKKLVLRLKKQPTVFVISNVFIHDLFYRRLDEDDSTVKVRFLANAFNADGSPNKMWYGVEFLAYFSTANGNRWIVTSEQPGDEYGIDAQA